MTVAVAGCSGPTKAELASDFQDFAIVAYRGGDVLDGEDGRFADAFARGRPVVLNFWAGQCPPCRAEMPAFQRVADTYHDKVTFVGVDVGVFTGLGTREDGERLIAELAIRYPTGQATDPAPLRAYRVRSMPTTVFFDAQGRIVLTASGLLTEEQLRDSVEKLSRS